MVQRAASPGKGPSELRAAGALGLGLGRLSCQESGFFVGVSALWACSGHLGGLFQLDSRLHPPSPCLCPSALLLSGLELEPAFESLLWLREVAE